MRTTKIKEFFAQNLTKVMQEQTQKQLGDRSTYIGASDIGGCLRKSYLGKIKPSAHSTKQQLIFLRGHLAEQILQTAFDGLKLISQVEVGDEALKLKAHIDFVLEDSNEKIIFECKSVNSLCTTPYESWQLQVQLQMHLLAKTTDKKVSAYVFAIDVNEGEFEVFEITPNSLLLELALEKAQTLKNALENKIEPKASIQHYCHKCPYKNNCPMQQCNNEVDQKLLDEANDVAKENKFLNERQKLLNARKESLKKQLEFLGLTKLNLENGLVSISAATTRKSFDTKRFSSEHPELFLEFQKESSVKSSLKIV